jgi:hypothetical protein
MRANKAIALQWKHIGEKFIAIAQSITIKENGHQLNKKAIANRLVG